jgi:hypothetical protein
MMLHLNLRPELDYISQIFSKKKVRVKFAAHLIVPKQRSLT